MLWGPIILLFNGYHRFVTGLESARALTILLYLALGLWTSEAIPLHYWGFSVLFPQLWGKYQGKPRKDGARPALFCTLPILHSSYPSLFLFRELYCSRYCCDFNALFYVLFDCVVLYIVMYVNVYYCHRVSTQLQLNILSIYLHLHTFRHIHWQGKLPFMDQKCPQQCSQKPANGPCPEPYQSTPYIRILLCYIPFYLILYLVMWCFPFKISYYWVCMFTYRPI